MNTSVGGINTRMAEAQVKSLEKETRAYNIGLSQKTGKNLSNEKMGKDEFLKLLTTQLSHQDPLSPMDNKDFIAQMAQFSSLEQMLGVNQNLEAMKAISDKNSAYDMLGRNVSFVNDNGNIINGRVSSLLNDKEGVILNVSVGAGTLKVKPEDVHIVHGN